MKKIENKKIKKITTVHTISIQTIMHTLYNVHGHNNDNTILHSTELERKGVLCAPWSLQVIDYSTPNQNLGFTYSPTPFGKISQITSCLNSRVPAHILQFSLFYFINHYKIQNVFFKCLFSRFIDRLAPCVLSHLAMSVCQFTFTHFYIYFHVHARQCTLKSMF